MGRSPFEPKSGAGLVIPVAAIALALGVGAFMNRDSHGRRENGDSPQQPGVPPPPPQVKVLGWQAGRGNPQSGDQHPIFPPNSPGTSETAAWFRFDLLMGLSDAYFFQRAATPSVHDLEGHSWPFETIWTPQALYLTIPKGYSHAPHGLIAQIGLAGRIVATAEYSGLPKAAPHAPPKGPSPWPGLVAFACRTTSPPIPIPQIFVDAPMPSGHILAARVLGTNWSTISSAPAWGLKGPEPGPFQQTILWPSRYTDPSIEAYVEVTELAPVHVRRQLTFRDLPIQTQYGEPWFTKSSSSVPFAEGISFTLSGTEALPLSLPSRRKKNITLALNPTGILRNIHASLVEPTLIQSIPISLRTTYRSPIAFTVSDNASNWTTGPLEFQIDVDADSYRVVKRANVAIDLKSVKTLPPAVPNIRYTSLLAGDKPVFNYGSASPFWHPAMTPMQIEPHIDMAREQIRVPAARAK